MQVPAELQQALLVLRDKARRVATVESESRLPVDPEEYVKKFKVTTPHTHTVRAGSRRRVLVRPRCRVTSPAAWGSRGHGGRGSLPRRRGRVTHRPGLLSVGGGPGQRAACACEGAGEKTRGRGTGWVRGVRGAGRRWG